MESGFRYEKFWGKIGSVNTDRENYTALVIISPLAVDCFFLEFMEMYSCSSQSCGIFSSTLQRTRVFCKLDCILLITAVFKRYKCTGKVW